MTSFFFLFFFFFLLTCCFPTEVSFISSSSLFTPSPRIEIENQSIEMGVRRTKKGRARRIGTEAEEGQPMDTCLHLGWDCDPQTIIMVGS